MFKSAGLMQGGGGFNVTTKPLSGNPLIWACQMKLANMAVGESHVPLRITRSALSANPATRKKL